MIYKLLILSKLVFLAIIKTSEKTIQKLKA